MNIAIIGPSGAGKGTQADLIAPKFGLLHISTGNLFRDNLEHDSALGILARKYMDQGELVPDEVVAAMVEARLRRNGATQNLLFDGYPRNVYQAKTLDNLCGGAGCIDAAIYLRVSDQEITINRIPGRLTCKECQRPYHETYKPPQHPNVCDVCGGELYRRLDDRPNLVRERLRLFHREAVPLVGYLQQKGKLIIVDGEGAIEEVNEAVVQAIESIFGNRSHTVATDAQVEEIQSLKKTSTALTQEQVKNYALDIVLLGAPGTGKGTQADQLEREFEMTHVATGDLFRYNLQNETDLGKLAKTYMDRGELVPDDVTQAMVRERLSRSDTKGGVVLDGFPRTLPQAEALTDIMNDLDRRVDCVIFINTPDEEIITRLAGRWICRQCQTPFHKKYNPFQSCPEGECQGEHLYQRDDDNPATIRKRLKTFYGQTAPLINFYRKKGILMEIDGTGSVDEVNRRVRETVQALIERQDERRAAEVEPLVSMMD